MNFWPNFLNLSLSLQGFLTKSGLVNPNRVQMIMEQLGRVEDAIFKERQSRELRFKAMNKARRRQDQLESEQAPAYLTKGQFAPHVSCFFISIRIMLTQKMVALHRHSTEKAPH